MKEMAPQRFPDLLGIGSMFSVAHAPEKSDFDSEEWALL
jgi:hypothetical protein